MMTAHGSTLIDALQNPAAYPHAVERVEVVETHISWVLLTGEIAYKIKKPVDLGFLDFSTLAQRCFYCYEELRLNRRLAPDTYLDVVAITGERDAPQMEGTGAPLEYAVKMRQFPQEMQLDRMLARGELHEDHIDLAAREIAEFHAGIDAASPRTEFGTPERIHKPVRDNFVQIRQSITGDENLERLRHLEEWSERTFRENRATLEARKREGYVRECHGDMHLRNMAYLDERIVIFDCIEFNENLRWIDVMSEVAFLDMDLEDREQSPFARRFLNRYLELGGDYHGLSVLRYYQVYRALVRAKVAAIRLGQADLEEGERAKTYEEYQGYVHLAERYISAPRPRLILTHGLSGSGKTTITQPLLEHIGAIRVRSDVERKRLFGLAPGARSDSAVDRGIYTPEATERTYAHLGDLAGALLRDGYTVIVDAACLSRAQRNPFRLLAQELEVPFALLDFQAPEETLRARVGARARTGRDVSEANLKVLEHQLASAEPLQEDEMRSVVTVNTESAVDPAALARRIESATMES